MDFVVEGATPFITKSCFYLALVIIAFAIFNFGMAFWEKNPNAQKSSQIEFAIGFIIATPVPEFMIFILSKMT